MASRFVLTAQVQLQAPTNTRQVVNQIQQQLKGVNVNLNLQGGQQASRQINNLNKATKQATTQANKMGKAFGASIRRFGAFTIATRAVSLFTNSLANATKEAIDFEREIVKISQVTGKSVAQLKGLQSTITNLATSFGVSSKSILSVGRVLAQAGIQARDLDVALTTLAKTELAPTFDDITKTAEGAVAILAQFGQGVGALERQLGAINAVAGQFAVESGDLISVIRRTGGVFKAAGGDLNELIALFTSVRATTRESAESIATGLRTIFTRIQRPKTIEFLKQFGVQLTDLNGKFVGPFEAVRQLSQALAGLEQGDIRFVRIAEELGGFRQIGKVIPLLQQFETAERARQAALEGGDSLTKDTATAQQALAVQIAKVKEEFLALIRSISQTGSFQLFVKTSLELASALISVADALKPLIPLLATFGAIKFAKGAAGFARGIGAGIRGGGSPTGFARGGIVPGTGNRDSVPAMLTPGEFVIKKSSVKSLGAGTLAQMNENKFANGGSARRRFGSSTKNSGKAFFGVKTGQVGAFFMNPAGTNDPKTYSANKDLEFALTNPAIKKATGNDPSINVRGVLKQGQYSTFFPSLNDVKKGLGPDFINPAVGSGISSLTKSVTQKIKSANILDFKPAIDSNEKLLDGLDKQVSSDKGLVSTIAGYVFEGVITALTGAKTAGGNANFDFPAASLTGNRNKLSSLFGSASGIKNLAKADAKATAGADKFNVSKSGNIPKKVVNDINAGILSGVQILKGPSSDVNNPLKNRVKKASGGGISGSDTVPALLTPGEFVINKKAASKIGTANLNRMNSKGIQGFAKGGLVGNVGDVNPRGFMHSSELIQKAQLDATKEQIKALGNNTKAQKQGGGKGRGGGIKSKIAGAFAGRGSDIGQGLLFAGSSIAAFIPRVEGATEGMGALQNSVADSVMSLSVLVGMGSQFGPIGTAIGAFAGITMAATSAIDAYRGVHEKAKKTIEEGNVAEAGSAAVSSQAANDANKAAIGLAVSGVAAGAAIGSIVPGVGTAVGALVGGIGGAAAGVAAKFGLTEGALATFRDNILTLFGADSTTVIKSRAEIEASAARRTKELGAASKAASEALKEVGDGSKTIQEAFQSGAFTGGLKAVAKDNATVLAASNRIRGDETAAAGRGGLLATGLGTLALNATTFGVGGNAALTAKAAGADLGEFDPETLGDNIGAYIGLWEDAGTRTKNALNKAALAEKKQRDELNKELAKQLRSPEFKQGFDQLVKQTTGTAAALGRTAPTLDAIVSQMGDDAGLVRQALAIDPALKEQFENQVKAMGEAAQENAAFLRSLNFGLKDVTSGITAFNTNLDNITESSKTGYNSLTIATNTLAAVVGGAGAAISKADLDSSLNTLSSSFSAFGATAAQIDTLTGTINGFQEAQVNANAALDSLRSNLTAVDISSGANLGKVTDDFKAALISTIPDDSPIKDRLSNAFNSIGQLTQEEIEQFYNTGDASPILQKAFGPLGEQIEKQILGPMNEMQSVNAKLIKATEERRKAELKLVAAQKKAIDNQIEAAKNLEFFGGDKFTPEKEFAARRQQANLSLRDAGVAGLTTGSASDIRRASEDVLNRFSRQQGAQNAAILASGGKKGAFGDRFGVETDRRPELKAANQALLTITKQSIAQRKEELELIKKKNQAEKSALDSLLGGDVESFFDQAIGAAAGSALRTGDAAAASLFGAGALGKGLQGLQGTGLSDAENKRAAQLAFGSFGLGDRAAEVFTGTTTEEERIKAEGRELSQLQSQLGDQAANMESMDVTAKQVIINTQDAKFREIQSRVNQNQAALGLSRGGPVYASRGMFIPRGTDTVPAMLTPGEFVVNRAAVQRGNNLQILRSMNSNSAPAQALSSGGSVRYRANGSTGPEGPGGIDFSKFEEMVNKFQEVTDKLGNVNIKHMFEKLGTLDINHMFNGNMQQAFKDEILAEAGDMMSRSKFNSDGSITTSDRSVLG
jgi:TP901 family phage tail tape measure protein